jgi:hypothetical protein
MPTTFQARIRRKKAIAEEFLSSGMTRAAFCSRRKIALSTLDWWLRKTRDEKASEHADDSAAEPLFIPIGNGGPLPGDRYELLYADGRRLFIPAGTGIDDILRLVQARTTAS